MVAVKEFASAVWLEVYLVALTVGMRVVKLVLQTAAQMEFHWVVVMGFVMVVMMALLKEYELVEMLVMKMEQLKADRLGLLKVGSLAE